MSTVVLDTGALLAIESRSRQMWMRVERARRTTPIVIPAGCLAQAWRSPDRQARLASLLKLAGVHVASLDKATARSIGLLLAGAGSPDVVDAHVALAAGATGTIYTSDPDDIARLAPGARIVSV